MPWIWASMSGELYHQEGDGVANTKNTLIERGYSGRGHGRNRPDYQDIPEIGPPPVGTYTLSAPVDHPRLGPFVLRMTPDKTNQMHGRSGFAIHGDDHEHDASKGCIILSRQTRERIYQSGDMRLRVVDI